MPQIVHLLESQIQATPAAVGPSDFRHTVKTGLLIQGGEERTSSWNQTHQLAFSFVTARWTTSRMLDT